MQIPTTIFQTATICAVFLVTPVSSLVAEETPQSVEQLWADFDPQKDPLDTEIIREWKSDGLVLRYVRFAIGTFKGKPARLAAFYGFPDGTKEKLPAVMHMHGGGQRASLNEVKFLAARGYAALSVNWGGREMEDALPGELNTDWGAVDPTQQNVPGYASLLPGPKQFFEDREHPKNCNWYLVTLGCRRGLTFLEQQPEVDAQRLGIHGYSMGGNLTMYVAGCDSRVKVAVPAVGGQGWRWQPHEFIGGTAQQSRIDGDVEVFRRTLSFENYAPLIRCPVLHRSATNDFHGWMDDVYRTDALIPNQPVRHSWSPHFNHRLTPEVAVTMPLWLDQFLKGGPALPETPDSRLVLKNVDGVAEFRVSPRSDWPISRCDIYYSVDPDPRARFWRGTQVKREGDLFSAKLPLHAIETSLFAFANVYYTPPKPVSMKQLPGMPEAVHEVCLSTTLHQATTDDLQAAQLRTTDRPSLIVEDFAHGWRDWYRLNVGNRDHWQNWTRKVTDAKWIGPDGAQLAVTLNLAENNRMAFVVIENEWRNYRGPRRTFVCEKDIQGQPDTQQVTLELGDFKDITDGAPLKSWSQLDLLGLCAYHEEPRSPTPKPVRHWQGTVPDFLGIEWKTK